MTQTSLVLYAPLLAALTWAAVQDVRTRRIRNELTFPLVLAGIVQSFFAMHTVSPSAACFGLLVGFALTFIMFAMGAIGGGDVKLMAAVGAWMGPAGALQVFAGAALVGLVVVLFQSFRQKRLGLLFRNSAVLAINVLHAQDVGMDHVSETGKSSRSVDKPLPYAVPILAATVLVLSAWRNGL